MQIYELEVSEYNFCCKKLDNTLENVNPFFSIDYK